MGILHSFKNYNSEESTADSGQHDELNEIDKDTETQMIRKGKRSSYMMITNKVAKIKITKK